MSVRIRILRRRLRRSVLPLGTEILSTLLILVLCVTTVIAGHRILSGPSGINHTIARTILSWGMPNSVSESRGYPGWPYTLRSIIYMLTDCDLGNPRSFLKSSLPVLTGVYSHHIWQERPFVFIPGLTFGPEPQRPQRTSVEESSREANSTEAPFGRPVAPRDPQVLIYHTHSSEMYLGPESTTRLRDAHHVFRSTSDPTVTGVMEVGRHLSSALQNYGIGVWHESRIHDFPSLAYSYVNSEATVRELLRRHPSIDMVFDLHRDASIPNPVVVIDGRRVARILLVVGTAQDIPRSHPNWRENLQFATEVQQTAERLYPGLMRPILVRRDARYNQHLHPRSIILEVGSVDNTVEEALLAAELLARVIATARGNQRE